MFLYLSSSKICQGHPISSFRFFTSLYYSYSFMLFVQSSRGRSQPATIPTVLSINNVITFTNTHSSCSAIDIHTLLGRLVVFFNIANLVSLCHVSTKFQYYIFRKFQKSLFASILFSAFFYITIFCQPNSSLHFQLQASLLYKDDFFMRQQY